MDSIDKADAWDALARSNKRNEERIAELIDAVAMWQKRCDRLRAAARGNPEFPAWYLDAASIIKGAHYIDLTVRVGGNTVVIQADWVKPLAKALAEMEGGE